MMDLFQQYDQHNSINMTSNMTSTRRPGHRSAATAEPNDAEAKEVGYCNKLNHGQCEFGKSDHEIQQKHTKT